MEEEQDREAFLRPNPLTFHGAAKSNAFLPKYVEGMCADAVVTDIPEKLAQLSDTKKIQINTPRRSAAHSLKWNSHLRRPEVGLELRFSRNSQERLPECGCAAWKYLTLSQRAKLSCNCEHFHP
jgi:hypothetical protein